MMCSVINYEVCVATGDVWNAGTNANVFMQIYGELGKTEVLILKNRSNNYERRAKETFKVEAADVGKVYKIRIGHDGMGFGDGWFLDSVTIKKLETKKKKKKKKKKPAEENQEKELGVMEVYNFSPCRWLASDEEDKELVVELTPDEGSELEVRVLTGSIWGAGTDANVYLSIYGERGDTGERHLKRSDHLNKFEKGQVDTFSVQAIDLGELKKVRIRQDNTGSNPAWFLERIEIIDTNEESTYYFPCQRWLAMEEDDGQIARELVPVDEAFVLKASASLGLEQKAQSTTFTVTVKTGDKKYGGTDSNVFIVLYGTKDDTGWFLEWVEVDAPCLGLCLVFPCGRWLDKSEDDGAIERVLFPADLKTRTYVPFVPYEVTVFTSDIFGAGTDADVYIVLYGADGVCTQQKSLCQNKRERRMFFERFSVNQFIVELEDVGDILEKIRIGHDNSGINPGWHLTKVQIRRLLRNGKGSEKTTFPCDKWLATSEDDGEIMRELVPSKVFTEKLLKDGTLKQIEEEIDDALEIHTYKITVYTGDISGAGTDASVFLIIYGDLGDTGERKLSKSETCMNKFERGQEDMFTIKAVDLGTVYKIRIRHDNSFPRPDWYLEKVEILDENTDDLYLFQCERWLSRKKEDNMIERILWEKVYHMANIGNSSLTRDSNANVMDKETSDGSTPDGPLIPYHIIVTTGSELGSDTDSRVFLIMMGPQNIRTERLWLDLPEGRDGFADASVEKFYVMGRDVEELKKIEAVDGCLSSQREVTEGLVEGRWRTWENGVEENKESEMDQDVMRMVGSKDRPGGRGLCVFSHSVPYGILARMVFWLILSHFLFDKSIISHYYNLTASVPVGHDGATPESSWLLEEISIVIPTKGLMYTFVCKCWLARDMGDGLTSRVFSVLDADSVNIGLKIIMKNLTTQEVTTFTYNDWLSMQWGDKLTLEWEMPAMIDGEQMMDYTTYTVQVKTSDIGGAGTDANVFIIIFGENGDTGTLPLKVSNRSNKFERDKLDVFDFPDVLSLGELCKVRIWHDNKAYEILTITSDRENAETKENVFVIFEGKKGRSKEFLLENSSKKRRFLRGATDVFEFSSKNVGDIAAICVGHCPKDGKKSSVKADVYWHVQEIVVTEMELNNKYFFRCNAKIPLRAKKSDHKVIECAKVIESFASKARSLVPVKYEVIVVTGSVKGAGTDANVLLTIYGMNGDSGKRALKQKYRNLFERGSADRFYLEILELGELRKVRIEHDSKGFSPGWLVERVEITNSATGVTTNFPCGKWLDKEKGDGLTWREIFPRN
ncbi:hypothetical protein JD844_008220 [Phrynosoma platyrhinos]|uniref:PLAT domain-containing protein n=1 Tax=Phrynosoma platyrhinos TaxID=52577 RepID=A0ABQ7TE48_PHRPL|nr:hypothetical protein JD844_008220 [Phrynosoma platyrhinos]